MWTSHCQRNTFRFEHLLGKMAPWTVRVILDVALVDELFDVNHGMDHPIHAFSGVSQHWG